MESALWCSCVIYVTILKTDFLFCVKIGDFEIVYLSYFLSYIQIFKILHELLFQEQPNMDKAENLLWWVFKKIYFDFSFH